MEPALLSKKINRQKFPIILVNDSDQPRKLIANTRIGKLGAVTDICSQGTEKTRVVIANLRRTEDDSTQNSKIEENDRTQSEQERIPAKTM